MLPYGSRSSSALDELPIALEGDTYPLRELAEISKKDPKRLIIDTSAFPQVSAPYRVAGLGQLDQKISLGTTTSRKDGGAVAVCSKALRLKENKRKPLDPSFAPALGNLKKRTASRKEQMVSAF